MKSALDISAVQATFAALDDGTYHATIAMNGWVVVSRVVPNVVGVALMGIIDHLGTMRARRHGASRRQETNKTAN
jgi:hypothetical protein